MKEFVCIVCPNSCRVQIDEVTMQVIGQQCKRGEKFAIAELSHPTRMVTTTVRTIYEEQPVLSVRTDKELPKHLIGALMATLKQIVIDRPLPRGSVIVENVAGTSVNVISTATLHKGVTHE